MLWRWSTLLPSAERAGRLVPVGRAGSDGRSRLANPRLPVFGVSGEGVRTAYPMRSPANARHILNSIAQQPRARRIDATLVCLNRRGSEPAWV